MLRKALSYLEQDFSIKEHHIREILEFKVEKLPFKYVGTLLFKGQKKCSLFQEIMDNLRARISGWEQKFLSIGGLAYANQKYAQLYTFAYSKSHWRSKTIFYKMHKLFNRLILSGSTKKRLRMQ